jgi:hypothetical protein
MRTSRHGVPALSELARQAAAESSRDAVVAVDRGPNIVL